MSQTKWTHRLAGQFTALTLPWLMGCLDARILHYDRSSDPRLDEYNEHQLLLFWHEYIGITLPFWGHTSLTALCSLHRDGEWVNQTALALGLHVVRGSSSRGGANAIRQLKRNLKFSSVVMTPDGPRGPRREMAMGPIFIASKLQVPLTVVGIGVENPYRLRTWDQFAIPKPGARVRYVASPKLRFPKRLSREQLETARQGTQDLMNSLCQEAESWAQSGDRAPGELIMERCRRPSRIYFDQPKTVPEVASGHTFPSRPRLFDDQSENPAA